jgi:Ca2+-binding EF-hand superfamily protein
MVDGIEPVLQVDRRMRARTAPAFKTMNVRYRRENKRREHAWDDTFHKASSLSKAEQLAASKGALVHSLGRAAATGSRPRKVGGRGLSRTTNSLSRSASMASELREEFKRLDNQFSSESGNQSTLLSALGDGASFEGGLSASFPSSMGGGGDLGDLDHMPLRSNQADDGPDFSHADNVVLRQSASASALEGGRTRLPLMQISRNERSHTADFRDRGRARRAEKGDGAENDLLQDGGFGGAGGGFGGAGLLSGGGEELEQEQALRQSQEEVALLKTKLKEMATKLKLQAEKEQQQGLTIGALEVGLGEAQDALDARRESEKEMGKKLRAAEAQAAKMSVQLQRGQQVMEEMMREFGKKEAMIEQLNEQVSSGGGGGGGEGGGGGGGGGEGGGGDGGEGGGDGGGPEEEEGEGGREQGAEGGGRMQGPGAGMMAQSKGAGGVEGEEGGEGEEREEEEEGGEEGGEESAARGSDEEKLQRAASLQQRLVLMRRVEQLTEENGHLEEVCRALVSQKREMSTRLQFQELDHDHDGLVGQEELAACDGIDIPPLVLTRAFGQCVLPFASKVRGKMNLEDFVAFREWVDDTGSTPRAIAAWFRCLDIDGDGVISAQDLKEIYMTKEEHPEEEEEGGGEGEEAAAQQAEEGERQEDGAAAKAAAGEKKAPVTPPLALDGSAGAPEAGEKEAAQDKADKAGGGDADKAGGGDADKAGGGNAEEDLEADTPRPGADVELSEEEAAEKFLAGEGEGENAEEKEKEDPGEKKGGMAFIDLLCQVTDMIHPKNEGFFTLKDLKNSPLREHFIQAILQSCSQ